MIKVHIISDLFFEYPEVTDDVELQIPDEANLVILNGNIGYLKRSMMHAETLSNMYPDKQFVCNLGEYEKYRTLYKYYGEIEDNLEIRKVSNSSWPKNLHWSRNNHLITLSNGTPVDILCMYGFPKISSYEGDWKNTNWYKNYISELTWDIHHPEVFKPIGISNVPRGELPIWASLEWINKQHDIEFKIAQKWELTPTCFKILVTHINPFKDSRLIGQTTSPYSIHLNNMLWVSSDTKMESVRFLGARLVTNPGRGPIARSHIVTV